MYIYASRIGQSGIVICAIAAKLLSVFRDHDAKMLKLFRAHDPIFENQTFNFF